MDNVERTAPSLERIERRLLRNVAKVSKEFNLLEDGDHIMVCMSGGKDSYAMLSLLLKLQARVPFAFSITAVNMDQGQPGFPKDVLPNYFQEIGVAYRIVEQDTYSVVLAKTPEGKTFCSLCSRMRRGALYQAAVDMGATKIALGHHRDDIIETLLLNLFYSGQLKAMPPKLYSDDGRNVVIRPLAYCTEAEIIRYADHQGYPIIPCNLCGSQENMHRQKIKGLLAALTNENEKVPGNIFAALKNVKSSHLLDQDLQERLRGAKLLGGESEVNDSAQGASLEGGIHLDALALSRHATN